MLKLAYDLHIHSCLSPCADDSMTPEHIAAMAFFKGLDVIALTDHNSCGNCEIFIKICEEYGILGIAGIEVTTAEEVHAVCLFETVKEALEFGGTIYKRLLKVPNKEEIFGKQVLYKGENIPTEKEPFLLINATDIFFDSLYEMVEGYNGIMIPAHIDKTTNSLPANLGIIGEENRFVCAEIKHKNKQETLIDQHPYLKKCSFIYNSDAHFLEDISEKINYIKVEEKSIKAVFKALGKK